MAKKDGLAAVTDALHAKAGEFGISLVDTELVREGKDRFLRIYIDKPGGVTLEDCEVYHRAAADLVEEIDFDYLEVSSPGLDRPLKKITDFDMHRGEWVEVHLYRPQKSGEPKIRIGKLIEASGEGDVVSSFRVAAEREDLVFSMKDVSLVRPYILFEEEGPEKDRAKMGEGS